MLQLNCFLITLLSNNYPNDARKTTNPHKWKSSSKVTHQLAMVLFSLSYSLCVTGEGVPPISEMANNGHSAQLDISQMGDFSFRCLCVCVCTVFVFVLVLSIMDILYLRTTYLGSVFTLQQLHFHWGHNDTTVSVINNFEVQRSSGWLAFLLISAFHGPLAEEPYLSLFVRSFVCLFVGLWQIQRQRRIQRE